MKLFWDLIEENLGADFAQDEQLRDTILSLSLAFTEERDNLPDDYLDDPELQAAYLAYFVPLNFEKARMLLSSHSGLWPSELDAKKTQRWIDFGSGPGTATLAAMAAFKDRYKKLERLPAIHVDLVDRQAGALNLADILITRFAALLKLDVKVTLHEHLPAAAAPASYDLALAANVLNELPPEAGPDAREALLQLWDLTGGALLVLEPGHRVSSQRLIRFRERLLKSDRGQVRFLGPCPHNEKCPLYRSKHWCHFSEPVRDGRLTDLNLRVFKDPRNWLKFSYLLLRRAEPQEREEGRYRAIGDLHFAGPKNFAIDLCQPGEKFSLHMPANIPAELRATLVRGATVWIDGERTITARPLTKRDMDKPPQPRGRAARNRGNETETRKPKPLVTPKRRR